MNMTLFICAAAIAAPAAVLSYEQAFESTKAGRIEVKTIPERTLIVAEREDGYFDGNNALFGKLFRYIKDNDVSMTVPVKAEMDPGKMYFYVGTKDLEKDLRDTDFVKVVTEPAHLVMSVGVRGGYSEKNFEEAREKLLDALANSKEWRMTGPAYAIYWNGPYVPAFMKRFEVHVPVEAIPSEKNDNA
jgi:effector-binding domain-containing protein